MKYVELKSRYKYMLAEDFTIPTGIVPPHAVVEDYITLAESGTLSIRAHYCWDGASGGMNDDETNMTPSLVHDAFYQLLRLRRIPYELKPKIDDLFIGMCQERGMSGFRAWYYRRGLKFGRPTEPEKGDEEVVLEIP